MEDLTLQWLIAELNKDGVGSKKTVLKRLQTANLGDLYELRNSVQRKINYIMAKGDDCNKNDN